MAPLAANSEFPQDVKFSYIELTPETKDITACGQPTTYNASKEFQDKKVVLVAVRGAFTSKCQEDHLPPFIKNIEAFKAKGVDQIIVIGSNDPFVMSAWGKANYTEDKYIIFASDSDAHFSRSIGWTYGERLDRYAVIIDHGRVAYAEKEPAGGVTVSGADAVLAKL